jgi:dienelactone hydrolase
MKRRTIRLAATAWSAGILAALVGWPAMAQSPSPAPGSGGPEAIPYDLGSVTIRQPGSERFRDMPVSVQGVIAVPEGDGPFPVALLMHGSYPFCTAEPIGAEASIDPSQSVPSGDNPPVYPCPPENDLRQYEGFGDLAAALATDGYLAIVPDMAPEYAEGFGSAPFGVRAIQIADAHLDALEAGGGFPVDVAGKVDLDRLVLVGHSRGGSLIVRYAADDAADRSPRALVLLTPAFLAGRSTIPATMPAALVIAQCDGDVGIKEPLRFMKQLGPRRTVPTLVYTIPGGTHNGFSSKLEPEEDERCAAEQRLPAAEQQALAGAVIPRFLDLALAALEARP